MATEPLSWHSISRDLPFLAILLAALPVASLWILWLQPPQDVMAITTLTVASFVVIFPVLEELVFRGLVQGGLLRFRLGQWRRLGLSAANLLTTALFALSHWPRGGWVLVGAMILPSLIFGVFRERHGRLLSPIALHVAFNGAVLTAFLVYRSL